MSETTEKRTQKPQTYVVQQETTATVDNDGLEHFTVWADIATVTVPPRTPRKTVIKQALADAKIQPEGKLRVRVLDADSAEVHEPEAVQPPMEWRL